MSDLTSFEHMFTSVFQPKKNERILLLYDVPTDKIEDNTKWELRRKLVDQWLDRCLILSRNEGFIVEILDFPATGMMNKPITSDLNEKLKKYNIIIAMTEFSITSSLVNLVKQYPNLMRCASMPQAEPRMMETVFSMDYSPVKRTTHLICYLLEEALYAYIVFSNGDRLNVDLRGRDAGVDDGDCSCPGAFINLPSGEAFIAPYEAVGDEKKQFGRSRTEGVLPFYVEDTVVRGVVKENKLVDFDCDIDLKDRMERFFNKDENRRNIAELGVGCNPLAQVTGNFIEDEKAGVHIAYGTSSHLGGKITSDVHFDIVFARNCRIYASSLILEFEDGNKQEIIKNGILIGLDIP